MDNVFEVSITDGSKFKVTSHRHQANFSRFIADLVAGGGLMEGDTWYSVSSIGSVRVITPEEVPAPAPESEVAAPEPVAEVPSPKK